MTVYTTTHSPLGELLLVGEESATAKGGTALTSLSVPGQRFGVAAPEAGWREDRAAFAEILGQLTAYFAGERTCFDIEFTTAGTPFQQQVWKTVETIGYGTTLSYADVAERCGIPRSSSRAVGAAIGRNPLLVVRPCHRVVASSGALTGYAGGMSRKEHLLALESGRRTA
ncbi:methylated-DNA--[protein]-cysteine S-methyltransferase [Streptomyces sp. NPDC088354]|uniref:methylated-DNA--[protein]-cysteine S-methyltransferase n=1 Tax=unclassified Streptomyces TaxID=2593676 RepID=UPI0029A1FA31|nr:methylated-DNA--[protein]-cysteine S-methyltransferase [Streptomyces sp. MI02-7b]MDX3073716.1 methylated-DNA--[protein]-cysteine S-methyltransferase [Streptomyces sp. MI02-7b]